MYFETLHERQTYTWETHMRQKSEDMEKVRTTGKNSVYSIKDSINAQESETL